MLKYKSLIITVVLALGLMTGGIAGGVSLSQSKSDTFAGDGYVLSVAETEGGLEAEPIYFTGGTRYQSSYPDNAVFKDVDGTKYEVGKDSFVMYTDGSVSSLTSGVVLNLDEVNGGLVNHYALSPGTVMTAAGDGYTVESNGTSLTFGSFLWKVSDSRYMIYSDGLQLSTLGGEGNDFSGLVQIDYLEDGVIRLTTETAVWQGVAAGATATMSSGVTLSFADKALSNSAGETRLALGEILLNAEDNIRVQSPEDWVPPVFDFTTIDGENGINGNDGEEGEAGNAGRAGEDGEAGDEGQAGEEGEEGAAGSEGEEGEAGEDGDDGSSGADGANGADGSAGNNGKSGSNGSTGSIPQNDTQTAATFTLTDFDLDTTTATGSVYVLDEDDTLTAGTGYIRVYNVQTNELVTDITVTDFDDYEGIDFTDDTDYAFSIGSLDADTQYRLVIGASYTLNNSEGTKDFVSRTFYTDSDGVFLSLNYALTNGFEAIITRKDYSTATSAVLIIKDSSGNEVWRKDNIDISSSEETSVSIDLVNGSESLGILTSEAAASDEKYYVTMTLVGSGIDSSKEITDTWKTLKMAPTLGSAYGNANNSGYFELSVDVESDPDDSIVGYYFKIYETGGSIAVKTTSQSTNNTNVAVYLDDIIVREQAYRTVAVAVYYDNEKYREVETELSDEFILYDQGDTVIRFEHAMDAANENYISPTQTTIDGTLYIVQNNLTIDTSEDIVILLESGGNYSYTITGNLTQLNGTETEGTSNTKVIKIPLSYDKLKENTTYSMSVWATVLEKVSDSETREVYTLLGSYSLATTSYNSLTTMSFVEDSDAKNEYQLAVLLSWTGDESDAEATAEANAIRKMVFTLYKGSSNAGTSVGTYTITADETDVDDTSGLATAYYNQTDTSKQLQITNTQFGYANNALSENQYYLEVTEVLDYTSICTYDHQENLSGYANEVPVNKTGITITMSNALPSLPSPQETAVGVTLITNEELGRSPFETVDKVNDLDDSAIVGVLLSANYDNQMDYLASIRYYGFRAADYVGYTRTEASNSDNAATADLYEFAFPVMAERNGEDAPTLRVLFLDCQESVSSGNLSTFNVSTLDTQDQAFIRGVQTDTSGNPYVLESSVGYTVFTGESLNREQADYELYNGSTWESLGRGFHYIFAYNARLDVEGSTTIYPDDYKLQTITSRTGGMLRSSTQSIPWQDTQVKMYLDEIKDAGNSTYNPMWKMAVESDPDGIWDDGYTGADATNQVNFVKGVGTETTSHSYTPSYDATKDSNGYYTVSSGNFSTSDVDYTMCLYQERYSTMDKYDVEKDDDDTSNDSDVENYQELASHHYTRPLVWDDTVFTGHGISITADYPNSSNTVEFTISGTSTYVSRISRVSVYACNGYTGYPVATANNPAGNTGLINNYIPSGSTGTRTFTVDLTQVTGELTDPADATSAKHCAFKVAILYDTGFAGLSMLESVAAGAAVPATTTGYNGYHAAKMTESALYMNDYFTANTAGGYTRTERSNEYLYGGAYQLKVDSAMDADGVTLELTNMVYGSTGDSIKMPIEFGAGGSKYVPSSSTYAAGTAMVFSEMAQASYMNADGSSIVLVDGNPYVEVDTLFPSVSNLYTTMGLTTASLHFTTASYSLLDDENGSRYLYLYVYGPVDSSVTSSTIRDTGYSFTDLVNQYGGNPYSGNPIAIEITDPTSFTTNVELTGLRGGQNYIFVLRAMVDGSEVDVLYSSYYARLANETMSGVTISNASADDIKYTTYNDKSVTINYELDLISGFDIVYTIEKYSDSSRTNKVGTYTQEETMALMGYTLDGEGNWVDGNGNIWSYTQYMSQTISLDPAETNGLDPGYYYNLVITAVVTTGSTTDTVGTATIPIDWSTLYAPVGHIEINYTGTNSSTITWRTSLSDTNHVVVDDTYIVAYWSEDEDKWVAIGSYSTTGSSTADLNVNGITTSTGVTIGIFAAVDQDNEGNVDALDTKDKFDALAASMTTTELESKYLITSTTKAALDTSWGGLIGRTSASASASSGNVVLYLYNSTGVEKIDKLVYTLMSLDGSSTESISKTVTSTGGDVFTNISGTENYQVTLQAGITEGQWALVIQLYVEDKKIELTDEQSTIYFTK